MKKIISVAVIFILSMSIIFSGCGKVSDNKAASASKDTKEGKTLICAQEFEPEKINPVIEAHTCGVEQLLFRGLMRFDKKGVPQKDIAEDYSISEDGKVYIFKIRKDVKFHDNEPLTAKDVEFTINTLLSDKLISEVTPEFEIVKSVEVLNDYEIKIILNEQYLPFLDKLTVGIVPKHAFKDGEDINNSEFNHKPIGTGPYKMDKWEKGKSMTMTSFKDFYGTTPKIEKVIFKFIPEGSVRALQLKSGEVDVALLEPSDAKEMKEAENVELHVTPTADYRCMMYNLRKDLWKDVQLRKALNHAVDRNALVDGILIGYGKAAYSPLQLNKFNNTDIEKYQFNLEKANKLLEEDGWIKNENGIREKKGQKLAFTITAPISDKVRVNLANYLASQFKKVGADVKVDALDWSVIDIAKVDAFILGWGSPFDADDHTYRLFHSSQIDSGWNFQGYTNTKVDKLLEEGRIGEDEAKRKEIYMEFQKELSQDPPFNFLVYLDGLIGTNKKVTGLTDTVLGHHAAGYLWNIEEWDISE